MPCDPRGRGRLPGACELLASWFVGGNKPAVQGTAKSTALKNLETHSNDTLMTIDEFTAKIPSQCNVAIKCGTDQLTHNVWLAKTEGTLRVVTEDQAFEHAGVRYGVGDKYFVVHYYRSAKMDTSMALTRDNVAPNRYERQGDKGYVHNHLILPYYGFDMPFSARLQGHATLYYVPDHDRARILELIDGGTTGRF